MPVIFQIRRGAEAPNAKLTDDDVRAIRLARQSGEQTIDIAKRYGVSGSQISKITLGKAWGHVD